MRPRENVSLCVPADRVADAAEAAVAGGDLRLQHARDAVAEPQIGVADNAGAQPALAVAAARAHRRGAVDEFDFADRLHLRRAVGAIHRAAFDKDALRDVVAAAGIGEQLVEQIAVAVAIPQVMMRVDDLERGLEDLLLPLRPPGRIAITRGGRSAAGYGSRRRGICLSMRRGPGQYSAAKRSCGSGQQLRS